MQNVVKGFEEDFFSIIIVFSWIAFFFAIIFIVQEIMQKMLIAKTNKASINVIFRLTTCLLQWGFTILFIYYSFKIFSNLDSHNQSVAIRGLGINLIGGYFVNMANDTVKGLFVRLMNFSFLTIRQKKRVKKGMLYLRGFEYDNYSSSFEMKKNRSSSFFSEYFFCKAAKKRYPIYAVGMTKEINQPLGSSRFYLEDETWQEDVESLMNTAKYIFILLNDSESCIWEIERAKSHLCKTYIFVDDINKYTLVQKKTNIGLPDSIETQTPFLLSWTDGTFESHECANTDESYELIVQQIERWQNYKEIDKKRREGTLENDLREDFDMLYHDNQ